MKKPNEDDMLLAADWLDENEGDPDESEPMKRVAVWLREQAIKSQSEKAIRDIAKKTGCTLRHARLKWEEYWERKNAETN